MKKATITKISLSKVTIARYTKADINILVSCNVIYLGFFCPSTQSWMLVLIGGCCIFFCLLIFFSLWSFDDFFEIVVVFDNYKKHHHHHKSMFGQTGLSALRELFGDVFLFDWGGRRHLSFFLFVKDTLIFCVQNLMVQSQMRVCFLMTNSKVNDGLLKKILW